MYDSDVSKADSALKCNSSKNETPSYGLIDSQSVKTFGASEERGYDIGKKTKGRKRHIVVNTLGNLLQVIVHASNVYDTKAGCDVLKAAAENNPHLKRFRVTPDIEARL